MKNKSFFYLFISFLLFTITACEPYTSIPDKLSKNYIKTKKEEKESRKAKKSDKIASDSKENRTSNNNSYEIPGEVAYEPFSPNNSDEALIIKIIDKITGELWLGNCSTAKQHIDPELPDKTKKGLAAALDNLAIADSEYYNKLSMNGIACFDYVTYISDPIDWEDNSTYVVNTACCFEENGNSTCINNQSEWIITLKQQSDDWNILFIPNKSNNKFKPLIADCFPKSVYKFIVTH